jgi:hypothetical protein
MNVDRLRFREPVRVLAAPGQPIDDIGSVEQALNFLQQWPGARQGPVYRAARKSFANFARITGTLVNEKDTSKREA